MNAACRAAFGAAAFSAPVLLGALALALSGCANVKPYQREKLADPIMSLDNSLYKQSLERKLFSTREAAIGGGTGIGGGCGCAK